MLRVTLRAYASLNDFLPRADRHRAVEHAIEHSRSVKDFVESAGIPHPEIDLLLVNSETAPFDRLVADGDRVAAFPRFFNLDVAAETRVRPPALPEPRFALDVHLGRLARHLRLAGVDARYGIEAADDVLASVAAGEQRILLTRDVALLKRRIVNHGYFVRATEPRRQFVEILRHFGPFPLEPFSRCLRCNGELRAESKASVVSELLPRTREHYDEFRRCAACGRLFWKGSHYVRLVRALEGAVREAASRAR